MTQRSGTKFEQVFSKAEKAALDGDLFLNYELVGIDLAGANLRGAHFERMTLVGCDFSGADLRGASFQDCELRAVVLADAIFEDNRFEGTRLIDVHGLSLPAEARIREGGGTFPPAHASLR